LPDSNASHHVFQASNSHQVPHAQAGRLLHHYAVHSVLASNSKFPLKVCLCSFGDTSGSGAVADLPAKITLHTSDGSSKLLDPVTSPAFAFHKSVDDFLTNGTPMQIQATASRDVVAIMQAAEESALKNGNPVTPILLRA